MLLNMLTLDRLEYYFLWVDEKFNNGKKRTFLRNGKVAREIDYSNGLKNGF